MFCFCRKGMDFFLVLSVWDKNVFCPKIHCRLSNSQRGQKPNLLSADGYLWIGVAARYDEFGAPSVRYYVKRIWWQLWKQYIQQNHWLMLQYMSGVRVQQDDEHSPSWVDQNRFFFVTMDYIQRVYSFVYPTYSRSFHSPMQDGLQ